PASPSARATDFPMPRLPPVSRAVRPASENVSRTVTRHSRPRPASEVEEVLEPRLLLPALPVAGVVPVAPVEASVPVVAVAVVAVAVAVVVAPVVVPRVGPG